MVNGEMSLKSKFKKHNMGIQFWAYEGGNINASIAGSGGYEQFWKNVTSQDITTLASSYPDATTAILIGTVVVAAPALRTTTQNTNVLNTIDSGAALASAGILGYTLTQDASWITTSASSFVVGSSFLRFAQNNPFFLKAGGLALAFGGAALTTFGIDNMITTPQAVLNTKLALDTLTSATGLYVTSASLLTYEGGIFETCNYKDKGIRENSWTEKLTHPVNGSLSKLFVKYVDAPIQKINAVVKETMLRYIPKTTRDNKPFLTSMWARLPWRITTGAAALFSGDWAFALSNAGWGVGDTAIGSLDWEDEKKNAQNTPNQPEQAPI